MKTLEKFAEIRSGYSFRGRVEPVPDGLCRVIEIKDVDEFGRLDTSNLIRTHKPDKFKETYFVRLGDVLVISRGSRNHAAAITEDLPETIAGAQFFVIRSDNNKIMPQYLAWYLNQTPAQTYLGSQARGTGVPLIHKDALAKLPLEVPPLVIQRQIIEIYALSLKERELLETIQRKRQTFIETALLELARKNSAKK